MLSDQRGQSLLEVVIALAVIVMIVGALTFATISSIRNAQTAKNQSQATKLAQEGIEWVRTGRDRNKCITINGTNSINSWNGKNTDCANSAASPGSIWQSISQVFNNCEQEQTGSISTRCYFKVTSDGTLLNGQASSSFPSSSNQTEGIPASKPLFYRSIIVSDDINDDKNLGVLPGDNPTQIKKVTAIVQWNDYSGTHQSRLTTILRKL